jgi:hypothetical protein
VILSEHRKIPDESCRDIPVSFTYIFEYPALKHIDTSVYSILEILNDAARKLFADSISLFMVPKKFQITVGRNRVLSRLMAGGISVEFRISLKPSV